MRKLAFLLVVISLLGCNVLEYFSPASSATTTARTPSPSATASATANAGSLSPSVRSMLTDCAKAIEPTQQDIDYILGFTGETFKSDEWQRSYTVQSDRAMVTWLNDEAGAMVHLNDTIFSCGYDQKTLEDYYSDQNIEGIILHKYPNLKRTARCVNSDGSLTLYEFSAAIEDVDYSLRFWIRKINETRMMDLLMAFPKTDATSLNKYAKAVFPGLSSCP